MSVSKKDSNVIARIAQPYLLDRIAQLHQEIAAAELERRQLRTAAIVALHEDGLSLRKIGAKVGLSHGAVNQELAVYKAGNTKSLDCEACGTPVMKTTPALAANAAKDPRNYTVYCRDHRDAA